MDALGTQTTVLGGALGGPCPSMGATGGYPDGGLSPNEQSYKQRARYAVFYNPALGKVVMVDQVRQRYDRMRKRIKAWVELMDGVENARLMMITLTYRPGVDWMPNDIRDYMHKLKRKLKDRLLGYAWVAELQKRGAVHYHVMLYIVSGTYIPRPDQSGMWANGLSRVEPARTPYYLLSYLKKTYQKDYDKFPKGIRCYACWLQDDVLKLALRYKVLNKTDRMYVDMYGWDELPFWKKHEKQFSQWHMGGMYSDVTEAEIDCLYWMDAVNLYLEDNPIQSDT